LFRNHKNYWGVHNAHVPPCRAQYFWTKLVYQIVQTCNLWKIEIPQILSCFFVNYRTWRKLRQVGVGGGISRGGFLQLDLVASTVITSCEIKSINLLQEFQSEAFINIWKSSNMFGTHIDLLRLNIFQESHFKYFGGSPGVTS